MILNQELFERKSFAYFCGYQAIFFCKFVVFMPDETGPLSRKLRTICPGEDKEPRGSVNRLMSQ